MKKKGATEVYVRLVENPPNYLADGGTYVKDEGLAEKGVFLFNLLTFSLPHKSQSHKAIR